MAGPRLRALAAGLPLLATLLVPVASAAAAAVVRTDAGPVRGTVTADHREFTGIPYAAPPVGPLRWTAPRPPAPWTAPRDAMRPGNACPQDSPGNPMSVPSTTEDCLYLNVTTPGADRGRRPVLVWLHGGGLVFGAGANYGGAPLATKGDVVVVTVNYRLGPFGFLDHPALDGDPAGELSGNFGLQDQRAALRWVQRNAAAFGGDPGNVTLVGESSGGDSVCAQLTSPSAAGLFRRVVVQSWPCGVSSALPVATVSRARPDAERQGEAIAAELGCAGPDAAACLRRVPVTTLLAANDQGVGWAPVFGGPFLPREPAKALADGTFTRVPVLTGMNHDEQSFMIGWAERLFQHPTTHDDYLQQTGAAFGPLAAQVRAEYPCATDACAAATLAALQTDSSWAKPTLETELLLAGRVPVHAYEFADGAAPFFVGLDRPAVIRAGHTMELPYLFAITYNDPLDAAQRRLSDQMIGYWTRFAHTGDPNGGLSPWWPRFDARNRYVQSLAPGPGSVRRVDFGAEHRYSFWADLLGVPAVVRGESR
jgi:para-nitrobenzyl esterase